MAKLLLVEDDDLIREMLWRRLTRANYEVITAADGPEGIEMARQNRPDLILMDMRLPTMDGWQVVEMLKADQQTQTIPVIALTAYVIPGSREKALEAGCDDYETKPVNFPRLLSKINALLGLRISH